MVSMYRRDIDLDYARQSKCLEVSVRKENFHLRSRENSSVGPCWGHLVGHDINWELLSASLYI